MDDKISKNLTDQGVEVVKILLKEGYFFTSIFVICFFVSIFHAPSRNVFIGFFRTIINGLYYSLNQDFIFDLKEEKNFYKKELENEKKDHQMLKKNYEILKKEFELLKEKVKILEEIVKK